MAEYGTQVYTEPPTKGFGLVAWLMPVFYSVVGLALLIFVVRKWTVRPSTNASPAPSAASEAIAQARARAARETED